MSLPPSAPPPKRPYEYKSARKGVRQFRAPHRFLPDRSRPSVYIFEWAVILVIIGVTLTLSVGAYRRASGAATGASCAANLQRLGQMMTMYVQDNDGQYPPLPRSEPDADLIRAARPFVGEEEAWTIRLGSYREAKRRATDADVFVCPGADAPTYAYNAALGARVFPVFELHEPPATEADVKSASETFLFWDTANRGAANALSGWRFYIGAVREPKFRAGDFVLPTGSVREAWMRPRHNDAASVLYCDNHAARVSDLSVRLRKNNPFDPQGGPQTPLAAPETKKDAEKPTTSQPSGADAKTGAPK